jgi:predicted molibdopterin-dependent oxidoreductase YjgC
LADIPSEAIASLDVVVIGTSLPDVARGATVALPIANFAEEEGTFTNLRGRVQRFLQARQAPGFTRPSWAVLGGVLAALGQKADYMLASEVFADLAAAHDEYAGMSYDTLGLKGRPIASEAGVGAS